MNRNTLYNHGIAIALCAAGLLVAVGRVLQIVGEGISPDRTVGGGR